MLQSSDRSSGSPKANVESSAAPLEEDHPLLTAEQMEEIEVKQVRAAIQ